MNRRSVKLVAIVFLSACALVLLRRGTASTDVPHDTGISGVGTVETLEANYKEWEEQFLTGGGDRNVVLAMGWFKGLSTESTPAQGTARLDLVEGKVSVEVTGLPKSSGWDFWLIDDLVGTATPDRGDKLVRAGGLKHEGKTAKLEVSLGSDAFTAFEVDFVAITRAGKNPVEERVLMGTTTLFHRLYRSARRGEFGVLGDTSPNTSPADQRSLFDRVIDAISPTAHAQIGPIPNPSTPLQQLITRGRQSFFNNTFEGNGRTCGSCHREDDNLTISPRFIATLPPNDPLFVAEFQPALASNFENPVLMRKFGLILENVDGFGDLANRFAMRGVPHTLALLQNTLTPVGGGADGTTIPPNERTGWGGDGAPGTGTLREFILGAITQHYPKTLARVSGVDFRLATSAEMDELEAFMKSTGRRADLVLTGPGALSLKNEKGRKGQEIFNNGGSVLGGSNEGAGKCFFCHLNAGASDFFFPGANANFNTNVEQLPSQPADLVSPPQLNPADGGFGPGPAPPGVFGIGNGTFNTPVLVEAADTGPFFHNNSIATIEGAVDFYNSAAFNNPPGFGSLIGGIRLEATEVEAVAAFLRIINALENIRSATDLEQRAKVAVSFSQAQELLKLSIVELEDAIEVLSCGDLHPDAVAKLKESLAIDLIAVLVHDTSARNALINQAIARKNSARSMMVN
ncbi:MAG TPA: hypothetical protein VJH03_03530 [Blastocatellia bacterium]|nr:hypothetical protein [Blastocatellia bacterium]